MPLKYPFFGQLDASDCGPACLKMVTKFFGKEVSISTIRRTTFLQRQGTSMLGLSQSAESLGLKTLGVKINLELLRTEAPLPTILFWNQNHYVVLYKVKKTRYYIGDPAQGMTWVSEAELKRSWITDQTNGEGIALFLEPGTHFQEMLDEDLEAEKKTSLWSLSTYLYKYKKYFGYLLLGMLLGSLLELLIPFLGKTMIDQGVQNLDLSIVNLILASQLFIFFVGTIIQTLRSWLLLHISSRINVTILSEFIFKLLNLPLSFFDTRMKGDILQRTNDHVRIQSFLTSSTLATVFSFLNILVFSIALAFYSIQIFGVFMAGSLLSVLWVLFFLERRRFLDNASFRYNAKSQNILFELVDGIHELKLTNAELPYRWKWENVQAKAFKLGLRSLNVEQWQSIGNNVLNELKNLLVSYLAARLVIEGEITLGMMLTISYMMGSLNGPISQVIGFFRAAQDANISLRRLQEVNALKNEDDGLFMDAPAKDLRVMVGAGNITIQQASFSYGGPGSPKVFEGLNLDLLGGKVNAIVGTSGSGKTTLLKLLLKFYALEEGEIRINGIDLNSLRSSSWRGMCGVVMQDGYVFGDTIAHNIALGEEEVNYTKLIHAAQVANIHEFIAGLPLGYNTKIGSEGMGISMGQKQRILIARAVYKDPDFIFFDEATSSLDANNEHEIMHKLGAFFEGKTVVVVAHRLSTVRNADQIIVLEYGKVAEIGTHQDLLKKEGMYYRLINKQLT